VQVDVQACAQSFSHLLIRTPSGAVSSTESSRLCRQELPTDPDSLSQNDYDMNDCEWKLRLCSSTLSLQFYTRRLLCNISQVAMGMVNSESRRTTVASGRILINIRCNLDCFRPVRRFDLLGWGPVLTMPSKITHWGNHSKGFGLLMSYRALVKTM
jgi:hypothetical protein